MTSETELFGKDSIKLNILKELTEGEINISLSLGGGVYQDYLSQIHREGSRMQVLGKFNLSESPSGDLLTIRPIEVSDVLKVTFGFSGNPFSGEKKLTVFRSKTKTVERQYDINEMLSSVEFIPQGNVSYLLRLTYGEPENVFSEDNAISSVEAVSHAFPSPSREIPSEAAHASGESVDDSGVPAAPAPESRPAAVQPPSEACPASEDMQAQIRAAEEKLNQLNERRATAKDLLKKLVAEYQKDYDSFQKELEEYRQQFGIDQSVIDYYKDNDIQPIEHLIRDIKEKIEQAERQISLVILGRQKKTMEIENEVKSNKRQ